ncbi:MAG: hypothetical protein BWY63_01932 [Chloroflexi bacterium ADurb.Bin360]|nr:MAG: hypothetical protein BWY63_01932 [Chloroflexi bacterium ADurb.Bin360]
MQRGGSQRRIQRLRQRFFDLIAAEAFDGGADIGNVQVHIQGQDDVGGVLGEQAVTLLAFPKSGFGAFAIGNIAQVFDHHEQFARLIQDGVGADI